MISVSLHAPNEIELQPLVDDSSNKCSHALSFILRGEYGGTLDAVTIFASLPVLEELREKLSAYLKREGIQR